MMLYIVLNEQISWKCPSSHHNWVYLSHSLLHETDHRVQNRYLFNRIEFTCHTLYYNKQIPEFKTTIWSPELNSVVTLYIIPNKYSSSKQLPGHHNWVYLGVSKSSGSGTFFAYRKLKKNFFFHKKIERLLLYFSMLFDHYSSDIMVMKFWSKLFLLTSSWLF